MEKEIGRFLEELAATPEEEAMERLGKWPEKFMRTDRCKMKFHPIV
ncbi:MAG: hypothetical protein LBB51_04390 [Zoogloeaceae bacterium]|jgi:hypothetical protein|nr:hypothetical protein [Zoogloeaceae bacterium]